ncbi:Aspartate/alanine antiporter [Rubripirellula obstinata]|uniref:Aspartate/alanine antiporter n=1 Tax=Rubripirellula obstinata TaxID=406547 RepID=A0A5B1CJI6_9BACT|nr:putative transporter [Rubripirellula obstinata]KAA1259879.1 Aspartate/alanine antiporter [Rubripirellula obstinata]
MSPIIQAILVLTSVAVSGLLLGSVRFRGIGLGSAGVLFAGILLGHFGFEIEPEISEFAKEFGLVLFVFMIGLHLGPGIVQLWRQQGIVLNSLAFAVVLQGFLLICVFHGVFQSSGRLSGYAAGGLFSGATTNTPSLGAAQQAVASLEDPEKSRPENVKTLASAYAVAYPGGIVGIIAAMLIMKRLFRINLDQEVDSSETNGKSSLPPINRQSLLIDNARLAGVKFGDLPGLEETGIRISRIRRAGEDSVAAATINTVLGEGDVIQVVGSEEGLQRFVPMIGQVTDVNLMESKGTARLRRIVITEASVLNQTLRQLSLDQRYNATVTRIRRSGVEMAARGTTRLQYGDVVNVVGDDEALDRVTELLGNSVRSLDETHFAPIFFGIALGVLLGMIPFQIPGIPFAVKLGLAGGPLIAAILLSMIGRIGWFVWYIPYSANLALREMGIILFLACAGLGAGRTFFSTAMSADGLLWMFAGIVVTMVPLLTTGIAARYVFKLNYLTICGVVAGSMTDPPALAFANSLSDSEATTTAYAAVYPLTMMLRILAAQTLIYLLV